MEFLKSQKGKQKLAFEGHMYICDRKTENKTYWKCESGLCRGRLIFFFYTFPPSDSLPFMCRLRKHNNVSKNRRQLRPKHRFFFRYFFDNYYFDIFFDVFDVFFFDIFLRLKVNSKFCLIRCVDV